MKKITVSELKKRKGEERLQIIDVRSAGEFEAGHIPGAINMPLEQLSQRLPDMSRDTAVLVCHSGMRACMAHDNLAGKLDEMTVLEGGTAAWQAAGEPVVQTHGSSWSLERQVRLIAGLLALTGSALALLVNPMWAFLSLFIGAGLTFAGATNICGMALMLKFMPWNKAKDCGIPAPEAAK